MLLDLLDLLDLLVLVVIRFVKKCEFKHSESTNSLKCEQKMNYFCIPTVVKACKNRSMPYWLSCFALFDRQTNYQLTNGQLGSIWIIEKGISAIFEWSSIGDMRANLSRSFSTIIICNLKSIRCTYLKKMAKNLIFGYLDHSKWHFLWILNDPAWAIWEPTCQDHLVQS